MEGTILIVTEISKYVFVGIVLLFLFLVIDNSLAEYIYRKESIGDDTGRIFGYLTITRAADEELIGRKYGLKWENSIGSSKGCDICIPARFVKKRHAIVYLTKDGVLLLPVNKNEVYLNGERARRGEILYDGDILTLGAVTLRLRLREGGERT